MKQIGNKLGAVIGLVCQVKMAEIDQVLIYVVMDRNEGEVSKKGNKKTRPISSHLDQTS